MFLYDIHGLCKVKSNVRNILPDYFLIKSRTTTDDTDIEVYVGEGQKPGFTIVNLEGKTTRVKYRPMLASMLGKQRVGRTLLRLLSSLIEVKLLSKKHTLLHSAVLADANGRGIIIVAPPDTGKTFVLLEMLHRGFRFVSDDSVVTDGFRLLAFPSVLTLWSYHIKAYNLNLGFKRKLSLMLREKVKKIPLISLLFSEFKLPVEDLPKIFSINLKIADFAKPEVMFFLAHGDEKVRVLSREEAFQKLVSVGRMHFQLYDNENLRKYSYYHGFPNFEELFKNELTIYNHLVDNVDSFYLIKSKDRLSFNKEILRKLGDIGLHV